MRPTAGIARLAVFTLLLLCGSGAQAHKFELGRALLSIDAETYRITVSADLIEAFERHLDLRGSDSELIEQVRGLDKQKIEKSLEEIQRIIDEQMLIRFDGYHSPLLALSFPSASDIRNILDQPAATTEYRLVLAGYGDVPPDARDVSVRLSPLLGDVRLEVTTPTITLLQAGESSPRQLLGGARQTRLSVAIAEFLDYTYQGIIHIVPRGLDHILFILGLFLISRELSDLVLQVTAFTVAHTVTLTLGWTGVVDPPNYLVEPLIALSIVYVALENIWRDRPSPSRFLVVLAFGLLHGLGFASVLLEISPAGDQWLPRAIGFNIGVELGQLLVVAMAFLVVGYWRNQPWYRQRVVIPASALIALVGIVWMVQRAIDVAMEASTNV